MIKDVKELGIFDNISSKYKEKSIVQQRSADNLLNLLKIGEMESVIDVGCGPGHITNLMGNITRGRVVGIDISEGMINNAKNSYQGIEFRQIDAEDIDYDNEFDIAFCNSVFPWFKDPNKVMRNIFKSLKNGGRLGLACPATNKWAQWMDGVISKVSQREDIKRVFSYWKDPWFWLPAEIDYKIFFERCGFQTVYMNIECEKDNYSIEKAFDIYLAGPANGYIGKKYYDIEIDDDYISTFNNAVKDEFKNQSKDGIVKIDFSRLYYIGKKMTGRSM
jgi:ubiquinone/menaquinone biosynthesis C-methylase UbiE